MDAISLLAVAQMASFGGLAYLFWQVQSLRARLFADEAPGQVGTPLGRSRPRVPDHRVPVATARAARDAYALTPGDPPAPASTVARSDAAALLTRLSELDVDVPAMARRLHKSEEEVRLMLRRRAVPR